MSVNDDRYRHTKLIVTLGPVTESRESIEQLITAGVDVIRLNMAHASGEWVTSAVRTIRQTSRSAGRHVAIMMDVKGPEIRTGALERPIELRQGMLLSLHTDSSPAELGAMTSIPVNYPDLPRDITTGATILIDSGLIQLRALEVHGTSIECEVVIPGTLGSRRHINLPGVDVNLPALTAKDRQDLKFGVDAGIDFVALSFVRKADDVRTLRSCLHELGSSARIIAKIEEQAGVRNMVEIVRESDAIMVARGDLGIEIDYYRLPIVQSELVRTCQAEGKPVIIATQLLESMMQSPVPTRAEISDVCNAVREQADAVMLSGETTVGTYPHESVEVLKRIIHSIEPTVSDELNSTIRLREPKAKLLRSAAVLAQDLGNSGIVVFTRSGFLPFVLGALRPRGVPIYAFTDDDVTFRQLLLPWGVEPFLIGFSDDPEQTICDALDYLAKKNWCSPGDWLAVITNALASDRIIDTMQLRQVP